VRDLKLPLNDVKDLKKDSLAYHLLHQDKVHGIHKFWRSIASEDVGLPVIKIDDYMNVAMMRRVTERAWHTSMAWPRN
jgi:hypothetical protein